jgi:hypothetical protein
LDRRLQRLQVGCRQNDAFAAHRRRRIPQATFKHLSLDQKNCPLSAITSYQQGRPLRSARVGETVMTVSKGVFVPDHAGPTIRIERALRNMRGWL